MSHPSLKIFSLLFGVVYATVFYMEWALFRYYPETQSFYLTQHREDGPAILWYGWLAVATIVSAAANARMRVGPRPHNARASANPAPVKIARPAGKAVTAMGSSQPNVFASTIKA